MAQLQAQALDRWGAAAGILNPLFPAQLPFSRDMSAAMARAVNDWVRAEWLDRDARLRASILLPNGVEEAVAGAHRPFHWGERFPVKARWNSAWSSVVIIRAWA